MINSLFILAQAAAPEISFGPKEIWDSMTWISKIVAIGLILMSIWSLYVTIERLLTYARARKQSLEFAKKMTPLLAKDQPAEAIELSRKYKAQPPGARHPRRSRSSSSTTRQPAPRPPGHDVIEAAKRAIERESLVVYSDLKKGIGGLATIATTAPFIGLFGTVIGIINAFQGMALSGSGGIGAVSKGIAEALVATALGLGVAIPAAWLFNYFTNVLERFQVEMTNSASELVDFFIKKQGVQARGIPWRRASASKSGAGGIEVIAGSSVKSDINVTPLVDVCLVLLIIFMVVTPLLQAGRAVQLPETDQPGQDARGGQAAQRSHRGRRQRLRRRQVGPQRPAAGGFPGDLRAHAREGSGDQGRSPPQVRRGAQADEGHQRSRLRRRRPGSSEEGEAGLMEITLGLTEVTLGLTEVARWA